MTSHPQASLWILFLASATLFWAALTDFRNFKIRNEAVLLLAGLYFLYAIAAGQWASMPWNVGFAILMLAGMTYVYMTEKMGGGDFKLLTVAFLWIGPSPLRLTPFAFLLLVFLRIHYAAARFGWTRSENSAKGMRIPLAPSVAAALIGTFASASSRRRERARVATRGAARVGEDRRAAPRLNAALASISSEWEQAQSSGSPEKFRAPAASPF